MSSSRVTLRSREIMPADLDALGRLLPRGFPNRSREYFRGIFERLASHRAPEGFPNYGYLLESGGQAVGAVLIIYSSVIEGGASYVRGNVAYWYVEPEFRSFAALLLKPAFAYKDVTYINLSPGRRTWPILEAQGYRRYITGEFMAIAAAGARVKGAQVRAVAKDEHIAGTLTPFERNLLRDHVEFGCIALTYSAAGDTQPFVFERRFRTGVLRVPYARLVYCRSLEAWVRSAGPVGRFLALRGMPLICIDANGPIAGLIGKFSAVKTPKYFKGPNVPRLGDFAYTERVMFGN